MPGKLAGRALENFTRDAASTVHHQTCTAKMGRDEMSVVDSQLRVYNLRSGLPTDDGGGGREQAHEDGKDMHILPYLIRFLDESRVEDGRGVEHAQAMAAHESPRSDEAPCPHEGAAQVSAVQQTFLIGHSRASQVPTKLIQKGLDFGWEQSVTGPPS